MMPGNGYRRSGLAALLFLLLLAGAARGVGPRPRGREGGAAERFYRALRSYYRVPEAEIARIAAKGVSCEELPVVFFIAENGRVETSRVVRMRLSGRTWTDIAFRFGLTPDVFYVPLQGTPSGPPFGRPYGVYNGRPKREWKTVFLTDRDVVDLVNLCFLSANYRVPPDRIVAMASRGMGFLRINEEMEREATAGR